jgi:O-antigen/teichoic acid export membrane protein
MIENSAKGSLILILGQMTSNIISALGVIIVARILGSVNYGALNVAIIPVNLALLLVNNGVTTALTNLIAEDRHLNKGKNVASIIYSGYAINLTTGTLTTLILYITAGTIANNIYNQSELAKLIQILSITTLAQAIYTTSTAILIGYERMQQHSLINIIFSIFKSTIAPILVYLGYQLNGAALGHSLPTLLAGLAASALVIKNLRRYQTNGSLSYIGPIIKYSKPILASSILGGLFLQTLNFTLSLNVPLAEMGNYTAAVNFNVLISFILTPISTAMLPLLSKLDPKNKIFQTVYTNIIKYETLAAYPLAAAVIALSDKMINILYGSDYPTAILYVKLLMLNYFFIAFGSHINGIILNSQKRTDINLRITIIYIIIGSPIGILLIPRYGVLGYLIINSLAPTLGLLYSINWLRKNLEIRLELTSTPKIAASTLLGYIASLLVLRILNTNPWTELILGGITLALVYLTSIIATGALNHKNIRDIKNMTQKNKLGKKLNPILDTLEKIARK